MEEPAIVIDPAQPRAGDEVVSQDLAPEGTDLAALGEEPVPADVKAESLVFVGPADAAHQAGVRFEHHAGPAVLGKLVGASQSRGAAAGDHRLERGHHRLALGLLNTRPAVGNQTGADGLRLGRLHAHPRLLIQELNFFQPH